MPDTADTDTLVTIHGLVPGLWVYLHYEPPMLRGRIPHRGLIDAIEAQGTDEELISLTSLDGSRQAMFTARVTSINTLARMPEPPEGSILEFTNQHGHRVLWTRLDDNRWWRTGRDGPNDWDQLLLGTRHAPIRIVRLGYAR